MSKEEILKELNEILIDIKEEIDITEDTALIGEGILDSLELINYLTQIEEKFDITISLDELSDKELGLMKNMIDYIQKNS